MEEEGPTQKGTEFLSKDWFDSDDDDSKEDNQTVQTQEAVFADVPGIPKDLVGKPVNEENLRLLGQKNTELMGEFTRTKQALNVLVQEKESKGQGGEGNEQETVDTSMVDSIIDLQLERFANTDVQAKAVLKLYRKEVEEALSRVQNPRQRATKEMIRNAIFFVASQHFTEVMDEFKAGSEETTPTVEPKPKPPISLEGNRGVQGVTPPKPKSTPSWWDKMDDRRKRNLLAWYGSPEAAKRAITGESQ